MAKTKGGVGPGAWGPHLIAEMRRFRDLSHLSHLTIRPFNSADAVSSQPALPPVLHREGLENMHSPQG